MPRLRIEVHAPESLSGGAVEEMFRLFDRYYEGTDPDRFRRDLSEKAVAILLRDPSTDRIGGFTTIRLFGPETHGEPCVVMYSGDTVLDRVYWGDKSMQVAVQRYILTLRLRTRPWWPVYWMVTSKGYKTYLMVVNNLKMAFPRWDRPTPDRVLRVQRLLGGWKYGDLYDPERNVVAYEGSLDRVADGVAAPTPADLENRDIAFFVERNPGFVGGDELLVLAEFRLRDLVPVAEKMLRNAMGWRVPNR